MSIPTAPQNNLFVLIDKMYTDEIKTGSGVRLYQDTSFKPEWHVTITGHVVSTPMKLTKDNYERAGLRLEDIRVGDEAIFKYLVVEDKVFTDDAAKFFLIEEAEGRYFEFGNGLSQKVKLYAIEPKWWAGVYLDEEGIPIDGITGTRQEVQAWVTKNFKMLEDGEIRYENLMIHDGVLYWKVDYRLLIGFIREVDGQKKVHAGRGYVFVEPMEENLGDKTEGGIIIPEHMRVKKSKRWGVARMVGEGRDGKVKPSVKEGDKVLWDERFGEQYEIGGLPWIVLKQEHILGKIV
jgi:co-chaperonin GroES (HSP10)